MIVIFLKPGVVMVTGLYNLVATRDGEADSFDHIPTEIVSLQMPASRHSKCLQEKTAFTLTSNKYLYFYIPITRMTPL
jgi:hypothetical protein